MEELRHEIGAEQAALKRLKAELDENRRALQGLQVRLSRRKIPQSLCQIPQSLCPDSH